MTQLNLSQQLFNRYANDAINQTNTATNQDVTAVYNATIINTGNGNDTITGTANLTDSLTTPAPTTTTTSGCSNTSWSNIFSLFGCGTSTYSCIGSTYDNNLSATGIWNNGGSITFGSGIDSLTGIANVNITGANSIEVDSTGVDNEGSCASINFGNNNDTFTGNSNITINVTTPAPINSTGIENYQAKITFGNGNNLLTGSSSVIFNNGATAANIFAVGIDNHFGTITMGGGNNTITGTTTIGTPTVVIPIFPGGSAVASPATTTTSTSTTTSTGGCGGGGGSTPPPLNANVDTIGLENYGGTITLGGGNNSINGTATINSNNTGAVGIYNTGNISLGKGTDTITGIANVTGATYGLGLYNSGNISTGTGADTLTFAAIVNGVNNNNSIDGNGTINMAGFNNTFNGFGNQTVNAGTYGYNQQTQTNNNILNLGYFAQGSLTVSKGSAYNDAVTFNNSGETLKTTGFANIIFNGNLFTYNQLTNGVY